MPSSIQITCRIDNTDCVVTHLHAFNQLLLQVVGYTTTPIHLHVQVGSKSHQPASTVCIYTISVLSRAMTLVSIQVTCRDVEQQLLASDPTSETQLQRVRQLFQRQLLVPLAQGPSTLQAYKAWEASLPAAQQVCQTLVAAAMPNVVRAHHLEEACLLSQACILPKVAQTAPISVQCTSTRLLSQQTCMPESMLAQGALFNWQAY